MLTLEEFRKTRREVPDLSAEIEDTGGDLNGQPGFLYAGDVYMKITECRDASRYITVILSGWDFVREENELPMLEERLYEWAVENGALGPPSPSEPCDATTAVEPVPPVPPVPVPAEPKATERQIRHLTQKLIFLARVASDFPETAEIMERVRDALETIVDDFPRVETDSPPTVAAYFLARFGVHFETRDESDPEHRADAAHPEFTIETGCGEDCRMAIDTAMDLINLVKSTFGDDRPDLVAAIVDSTPEAVRDVITCYIYG